MPPAIRVENLSKHYRLGETHARSVRDLVNTAASRLFGRGSHSEQKNGAATGGTLPEKNASDFWALKDVSFEVQPGEVVGIIGRNGAGKSTLLKILSQIVAPTTGRIELHGRVASLLEVGTGFHPELTGRENVYLNGTILGMTKAQVRRRFDEIVAFADVDTFIDTPVKRYSSGMTVRLAFAVAAYLESEILVIDEVLAVGDVEFQRKCLGRMQSVSASGRTVLFVSHNMPSVRALTSRSIVLSHGKTLYNGLTPEAIDRYVDENAITRSQFTSVADLDRPFEGLSGELRFESLEMESTSPQTEGATVVFRMGVRNHRMVGDFVVGLTIFRHDESPVGSVFSGAVSAPMVNECVEYGFRLPTQQLAPGRYRCAISLADARSQGRRLLDSLSEVLPFEIEPGPLQSLDWPAIWGPLRFPEMQPIPVATDNDPRQSHLLTATK